jgi:Ubiquitin fusion degradation protein UFD1
MGCGGVVGEAGAARWRREAVANWRAGFGTGSKPFEGDFEARSFAADSTCVSQPSVPHQLAWTPPGPFAGKDELSCGDKVILPQTALKEIRQLRLPLPLLFEIGPMKRMTTARSAPMMDTSVAPSRGGAAGRGRGAPKAAAGAGGVDGAAKGGGKPDAEEKEAKKSGPFRQYCGVLEFSAPAGVCLMPDWMMKNLKIRNGTTVRLISQRDVRWRL